MKQSVVETLIGVLVVAVAAIFLWVILQGRSGLSSDSYSVGVKFYNAQGISTGGDVRMAGIKIGKVSNMELDPETFQANVTLSIRDHIQIPTDSQAAIESDGLLGGSFINIEPGADEAVLAAGDNFTYSVDAVSLVNLLASFASGGGTDEQ